MSEPINLPPTEPEFEPEPPLAPGPDPAVEAEALPAEAQKPVIVIEYRQRGLFGRLAPPALILAAALVISAYQRRTPVPLAPLHPRPGGPEVASRVTPAEPVDDGSASLVRAVPREQPPAANPAPKAAERPADPKVADAVGPGASEPAPVATSSPFDNVSPFDLQSAEGLRPVDPATPAAPKTAEPAPVAAASPTESPFDDLNPNAPAPAAEPAERPGSPFARAIPDEPGPSAEPGASKDDILADIRREAAEKDAQRKNLAGLKANARALLISEAVTKAEQGREAFRKDLAGVLAHPGPHASSEIDRLCQEYGRQILPEIEAYYRRARRNLARAPGQRDEVLFMRSCGLPEPVILDYLCHRFHPLMGSRNGPQDENEVRIWAARALLRIPVSSSRVRGASTHAAPARPVATAAVPGAGNPARP